MTRRRTRVKAQDMKTGEFAYLDQLVQDGFYPHLWVLPRNYEPAQPIGQSIRLPLEPIFNMSPPNIIDRELLVWSEIVVPPPSSWGSVGIMNPVITGDFTGVTSAGSVGAMGTDVVSSLVGITSVGSTGALTGAIVFDLTGVTSVGSTGDCGSESINSDVFVGMGGVTSVGSVTVPTYPGGWGANGWGQQGWGS